MFELNVDSVLVMAVCSVAVASEIAEFNVAWV